MEKDEILEMIERMQKIIETSNDDFVKDFAENEFMNYCKEKWFKDVVPCEVHIYKLATTLGLITKLLERARKKEDIY